MPKQCLMVRFDGPVTLTHGFLQASNIGDLYVASRISYHSSLLKRARVQRHAGSLDAQHLGKKILGEMQVVGTHQISCSKKPSAKSCLYMVGCHAGSRLARLRVDCLLMTKQR